ncbi:MAG: hypothetical protein HYX46_08710 [Betaproteobacteria bacterium]|nr:hypothetical protein [Betaproteobacteria bacterium]
METPQELSGERIKQTASESVRAGAGIRERVHDLTLEALRSRRFDPKSVREVVRAVSEGIALGAEGSRAELRQSLADAFHGLDEALRKTTEAGQSALRQLVATGRGFTDSELKAALASMKRIEDDFLATVGHVADAASAQVQPELRKILDEARRSGTETGRQVGSTLTEFAQRVSVASLDLTLAGLEAAGEFGARFALLAAGVLGGVADALRKPEAGSTEKKSP